MELSSNSHVPDGLLATMTLLSEKPRHGVTSWESAPHQGIDKRNCTALLGLQFRSSEIVSGIGSGFLSPNTLDFGASVYAVAATVPYPGHSGKPFSTIGNGPMLIDDSAASMRSAGLATPGCPQ